jgi:hypothetical protein
MVYDAHSKRHGRNKKKKKTEACKRCHLVAGLSGAVVTAKRKGRYPWKSTRIEVVVVVAAAAEIPERTRAQSKLYQPGEEKVHIIQSCLH